MHPTLQATLSQAMHGFIRRMVCSVALWALLVVAAVGFCIGCLGFVSVLGDRWLGAQGAVGLPTLLLLAVVVAAWAGLRLLNLQAHRAHARTVASARATLQRAGMTPELLAGGGAVLGIALVVVGPRRLIRLGVRTWSVIRTLQTLTRTLTAVSNASEQAESEIQPAGEPTPI